MTFWFVLLAFFQNCGKLTAQDQLISSLQYASIDCEEDLKDLFAKTYYPVLVNKCSLCHANGPGVGLFSNSDPAMAYYAFKGLGRDHVETNLANISHKPPYSGPENQVYIDDFGPRWQTAEARYLQCEAGIGNFSVLSSGQATGPVLARVGKSPPYLTLTWNLEKDVARASQKGRYPITFTIEMKVTVVNGVQVGYEFRNPSIKLNSSSIRPIHIKRIRFYWNDQELTDLTAYSFLEATVGSTTAMALAPSGASSPVVTPSVSAADLISLQIDSVE